MVISESQCPLSLISGVIAYGMTIRVRPYGEAKDIILYCTCITAELHMMNRHL